MIKSQFHKQKDNHQKQQIEKEDKKQVRQEKRDRSGSRSRQKPTNIRTQQKYLNEEMKNKQYHQQQQQQLVQYQPQPFKLDNANFDDDIDMFADEPDVQLGQVQNEIIVNNQLQITDQTGYYVPIVGAILNNKYKIVDKLGKGVFGIVVKVQDTKQEDKVYALKILRKNEATKASGYRQYKILTQTHQKHKLKRLMKIFDIFEQQGHLCLVCELLNIDLRSFSHRNQPTLADVRLYAISMMLISHELRASKIVHADIKPDNFLFKQSLDLKKNEKLNERNVVNNLILADFGTSFWVEEYNSLTQYQVARYYRAPQIMLGTKIKTSQIYAIDIWAMGCSLFELYTNQFLFNGNSNNEMLKQMMETKGKFSIKMLNKSSFREKHFDDDHNFLWSFVDPITKQHKIQRTQVGITADRDLMNMLKKYGKNYELKQLQNFRDFLQRCLTLNPKDRITPQQAIQHPFLHYQTKLEP